MKIVFYFIGNRITRGRNSRVFFGAICIPYFLELVTPGVLLSLPLSVSPPYEFAPRHRKFSRLHLLPQALAFRARDFLPPNSLLPVYAYIATHRHTHAHVFIHFIYISSRKNVRAWKTCVGLQYSRLREAHDTPEVSTRQAVYKCVIITHTISDV